MENTRRDFLKKMGMGSILLYHSPDLTSALPINKKVGFEDELQHISYNLLKQWCDAMLRYQITDESLGNLYGGLMCPACARIHGRCADAIYPFMYLAKAADDIKYHKAALMLYGWKETNVSLNNGSWVNDVNVSMWTGTTVFTSIALAETLIHYGDQLSDQTRERWMKRLKQAADFIHKTFHIGFSNINYPVSAAYALTLLGKLFNQKEYREHGKKLAYQSLEFFTPNDKLLYGEGGSNSGKISAKGLHPVDLGYNVEESLPALVMYGLHTGDHKVLEVAEESMTAHMEFMLPDGAWDNSWGTRNFKWTYWGSRTSDGCQTAYGLLADKDPRFYKVALLNTLLMKSCSPDGLLQGGPHYKSHGVEACIHHTFTHAKSLTTILNRKLPQTYLKLSPDIELPRETAYGVREMKDLDTWLVSNENWIATVTGYDFEYTYNNGHPTGGALSILWHKKLGPVLVSSINDYRLLEPHNMQYEKDPHSMPLTARLQTADGKYMDISDLKASIKMQQTDNRIEFEVHSKLVDAEQNSTESGEIKCRIFYIFSPEFIEIKVNHDAADAEQVQFVIPIISPSGEQYDQESSTSLIIRKQSGNLFIQANKTLEIAPMLQGKKRIFNHVPGMEAIPVLIKGNEINIKLTAQR